MAQSVETLCQYCTWRGLDIEIETILTAPSGGPVTSPNYPSNYDNNENARWLIIVPEGSTIRLTFAGFHTDSSDFLTIYDGAGDDATELRRLSGYHQQISPIFSTSNTMLLRFTPDGRYTSQGFQFSYISRTADQCWDPGVMNNGIRDNNSNFTSGQTVRYTCMTGYHLWGTANITCRSNGTWSDATPTCEVGRIMTGPSGGPVTSPNYPSNYGNNENVRWLITVPEGSIIRLTFARFDTEGCCDFLTIYGASDNTTELRRLSGYHQEISPIISTSNTMFLRFTSDYMYTNPGFNFSYISSTVGQCWDPGVPSNGARDNNSNFTSGQTVRYTCMAGYHLWGTANITCQSNRTWSDDTPTCEGGRTHTCFFRTARTAHASHSYSHARVVNPQTAMESIMTGPSGGPVRSPDYYSYYDNSVNTRWLIIVPEGSIIRLTVTRIFGSLDTVRILDTEQDYFLRGVKEAIYIRAHHTTLNRDGGRHRLPDTFNPVLTSQFKEATWQASLGQSTEEDQSDWSKL
ncbi:hypothetical protein Bbelb_242310 [Branchiostoma belcheri]|nr:hypothetical protein Bbelb_242310 [Branchiostoma belcheri]